MKARFTKCWTCPPALPGKGGTFLRRCPNTLCARVPLSRPLAEPHCGRQVRIWKASSSCWNAGAGLVYDALCGLSAFGARQHLPPRSLRIYAYDLLDFARWFEPQHQRFADITESTLVGYVRHQLEKDLKPTPQTVNHRLGTVRCCYRFHTGQEIPAGNVHFQHRYTKRPPLGYGRPYRAIARGLRLKQDRRIVIPLSAEEVAKFWQSFRTYRDLALVGLMLLDGLRSCEVLGLEMEDVQLADGQMRVPGKGNKKRVVPLPPEILEVLGNYLRLERPLTNAPVLFVSLKGRQRGQPMTAAGLRCATKSASSTWFVSGDCWRIWPPTAIPCDPISFVARISLPESVICPDRSLRRRINSCSRSCAEPMTFTRRHSCSSVLRESASVNASSYLWTACGRWGRISGPSMSPSASCTRSAWFPPIPRYGGPWRGSSPCVLWPRPPS